MRSISARGALRAGRRDQGRYEELAKVEAEILGEPRDLPRLHAYVRRPRRDFVERFHRLRKPLWWFADPNRHEAGYRALRGYRDSGAASRSDR